ncbi:MAG: hypothetical protein AB7U98_12240 [Candidatus Nitrosocosmicus sp.]
MNLDHHIPSPLEKRLIERTLQYIKDRTECFDDYFPCRLKNRKLKHVRYWPNLLVKFYNKELEKISEQSLTLSLNIIIKEFIVISVRISQLTIWKI